MDLRPITFEPRAIEQYCALFNACFPGNDKFTPAYVTWLYVANPDGPAVGFDAWEGERLAAHYVCIPARARVNGSEVPVLLSLNTATHPDFQGKGLFTKLAELTYQAGASQGFDGVYGVANANSTPGFIRKLGFQLVRPLEARVGFGRLHAALPSSAGLAFERAWNKASLDWRCANPNNPVRHRAAGARWHFHAKAVQGAPAYAELACQPIELAPACRGGAAPALRLFIGLVPDRSASYWNYPSIPARLRPSPLNLIYRSFSARVTTLDPALINFSFLDFDAY